MIEIGARRVIDTPISKLSISVSEKGVAAIDFLPSRSKLKDFSSSRNSEALVNQAVKQLEEYFSGRRKQFDLPLDVSGTEFQISVWKQIERVDYGKTKTYGQIAAALGRPNAARAVGGAVGANPIPIIIGCHRILGSGDKMTGYSGGSGIPTKIKLLRLEGSLPK